jgi:2-methylfumaryl-CoA isomerase
LFAEWFSTHTAEEVAAALSVTSVLWERYRSFAETVNDERVTSNPLFAPLSQPRIGEYLAPGLPMAFAGAYPAAVAAPALGDDTAAVLTEWLGLDAAQITRLTDAGTVA